MKFTDKLTTGVAYGASAGSAGYWLLQLLDKATPSQWAAIGVLGNPVFGLLTHPTNLYFKIKEDKRKAARGEQCLHHYEEPLLLLLVAEQLLQYQC